MILYIVLAIIAIIIIYGVNENIQRQRAIKKREEENILLSTGRYVRLKSGWVVEYGSRLSLSDKKSIPDYKTLFDYGLEYGYIVNGKNDKYNVFELSRYKRSSKDIDYMSLSQLREAANFIRNDIGTKKHKENIKKKEEEEKRNKEEYEKKERFRKREESIIRQMKWEEMRDKITSKIDGTALKNEFGVYVIHCRKTNETYIGSSIEVVKRKYNHLYGLKSNKHHSYKLQKSFNEFGENYFDFYLIDVTDSIFYKSAHENEKELIRFLKSEEQCLINEFKPEFNVEEDTRGTRHWKH